MIATRRSSLIWKIWLINFRSYRKSTLIQLKTGVETILIQFTTKNKRLVTIFSITFLLCSGSKYFPRQFSSESKYCFGYYGSGSRFFLIRPLTNSPWNSFLKSRSGSKFLPYSKDGRTPKRYKTHDLPWSKEGDLLANHVGAIGNFIYFSDGLDFI